MAGLGRFLLVFGIGSALLQLLHREFVILMWIDRWGEEIGWAIRIGMIVVGAVLWGVSALGRKSGPASA